MSNQIITEAEVEAALDYLRDQAGPAAQARANREYCLEFRKVVKAQIMQEHADKPLGAQERDAYADARYCAHLDAIREAVEIDEKHRFLMSAAQTKLDCWRTQSSNERKGY